MLDETAAFLDTESIQMLFQDTQSCSHSLICSVYNNTRDLPSHSLNKCTLHLHVWKREAQQAADTTVNKYSSSATTEKRQMGNTTMPA